MVKNIIIAVLLAISIFLGVFAQVQSQEAKKQTAEAMKQSEAAQANLELARIAEENSKEQEEIASQKAAEARIEYRRAEEAIANCK